MKIRFILNPVSGKNRSDLAILQAHIKTHFPAADIQLTRAAGHATELAREAAAKNFDIAVAIGGDGTINETARGLIHTQTALAVVPRGSGNGFARELGMPLNFKEAVTRLQRGRILPCDIGYANGELFLNNIINSTLDSYEKDELNDFSLIKYQLLSEDECLAIANNFVRCISLGINDINHYNNIYHGE